MSWVPLSGGSKRSEVSDDFRKRTRLLIDESLGVEVADFVREKGYNTEFVGDVGLNGRSDEDVMAYAWRHKRMLWTHDRDFLDDRRFPEHRNPGVVVLPGGSGDRLATGVGIGTALAVFGWAPSIWEKSKMVISSTGEMTVRSRNPDTGKMETNRYRMTDKGYAEIWEDG